MAETQAKRSKASTSQSPRSNKRKYDDASGGTALLQTIESGLNDLREMINCRICVHPMYEPYTTECGHTFCYGCLVRWFEQNRHKKSCPDCRANVKTQPSPSYTLRDITHLFSARAELLAAGETTQESNEWKAQEREKVELDRASRSGLFSGLFSCRTPLVRIRDHQDGVSRCPACAWELEEGMCTQCGWSDRSDTGDTSIRDDHSEHSVYDNVEHFMGLDEADVIDLEEEGAFGDFIDGYPYEETHHYDSFLEDTEEDEDDGSVGSLNHFVVDDNGGMGIGRASTVDSLSPSSDGGPFPTSDLDLDSEEDSSQTHSVNSSVRRDAPHLRWADDLPARYPDGQRPVSPADSDGSSTSRPAIPTHFPYQAGSSSDTDHEDAPIPTGPSRRRPRQRPRRVIDISDDEQESHEVGNRPTTETQTLQANRSQITRPTSRTHLTTTHSPIVVDSSPSRPVVTEASRSQGRRPIPGAYPPSFSNSEPSQSVMPLRPSSPALITTPTRHPASTREGTGDTGAASVSIVRPEIARGLQRLEERRNPLFPPNPPSRAQHRLSTNINYRSLHGGHPSAASEDAQQQASSSTAAPGRSRGTGSTSRKRRRRDQVT